MNSATPPVTAEPLSARYCPYGTFQRATSGYSARYLIAHPRLMVRLCHTRLAKKTHLSREQRNARHLYIRGAFAHLHNDAGVMESFKL